MTSIAHPFPFEHPASNHRELYGGDQYRFEFANGYGASVIRYPGSYGFVQKLWEVAVTDSDGRLVYTTPVTDNVIGYLSEQGVALTLDQICRLPDVS